MVSASQSLSNSALRQRLETAEAQVVHYQQELQRFAAAENLRTQGFSAAYQRLQSFAKDMKSAFEAELRKTKELEIAHYDTSPRLTHASLYEGEETGAHAQRLSHYAKAVALHLGLGEAEANLIFAAAPMHDIGKLGVPDAILLKTGPLTEKERRIMNRHPEMGANLLRGSDSPLLERAREIALAHHERWDGSGYPQGLKGAATPLAGRIVMLADQYDALRSQRSYKPSFTHDHTCDIILNGDGRTKPHHFDPQLLDAFRALHQEFAAIFARIVD